MKVFKKCCISNAADRTDDYMLWNDSKEDRNVRSECKEDESTDVKMETMTLIDKSRQNLMCFVY